MGLQYRVIVFRDAIGFKGQCFQIVYTLAIQYSLHRYIGPKVYTIWVHGPLGKRHVDERHGGAGDDECYRGTWTLRVMRHCNGLHHPRLQVKDIIGLRAGDFHNGI